MAMALICSAWLTAVAEPLSQPPLIASPREWVKQLRQISANELSQGTAENWYFHMLSRLLSGAAMACDPTGDEWIQCDQLFRKGSGAPSLKIKRASTTMTGIGRLMNVRQCVVDVASRGIPGGYLEAGVWRGGNSIMGVAALQMSGLGGRPAYLCDSFQGLPRSREGSVRPKEGNVYVRMNRSLAVSEQRVLSNFDRFGVARANVTTVPGYFVDSLPPLRKELLARGETLAILRMDGDMYDSTVDILYNLFDLVQVGGFVIIDDFGWTSGAVNRSKARARPMFGAKQAMLDFLHIHGVAVEMKNIDGTGAYFRKPHSVDVKRHLYLRAVESKNYQHLSTALSEADYFEMMVRWSASMSAAERNSVNVISKAALSYKEHPVASTEAAGERVEMEQSR